MSAIKSFVHHLFPNEITREQVYIAGTAIGRLIRWYSDSKLRAYRKRLAHFENKYKGKRCFLMGNGPSLNHTPLEKLAGEYVWGFNRCYLLFNRISWRPAFYTAVDTRVVPDNAHDINSLFEQLPDTFFFFPLSFRLNGILNSATNVYWYKEILLDEKNPPYGNFSMQVLEYVRCVPTVTIAAMQLAVYMGFNPIYLIGCDTNYSVPNSSLYEDNQQLFIISTEDNDPNHFDPTYFGTGKKYHQPYPEQMIIGYQYAKQICDSLGVEVYNATIGGKLDVFTRVDIRHLLNGK